MPPEVYKICAQCSWDAACRTGHYSGSDDDLRDGYIHLSTASQLRGTLDKHIFGQTNLLLVTLDVAALEEQLRWEASRGDALFPHLYGPLPVTAATAVVALRLDTSGRHVVPGDLEVC